MNWHSRLGANESRNPAWHGVLVILGLGGLLLAGVCGCVTTGLREDEGKGVEMSMKIESVYAGEPVSVDGKLDEAVWNVAPPLCIRLGT